MVDVSDEQAGGVVDDIAEEQKQLTAVRTCITRVSFGRGAPSPRWLKDVRGLPFMNKLNPPVVICIMNCAFSSPNSFGSAASERDSKRGREEHVSQDHGATLST